MEEWRNLVDEEIDWRLLTEIVGKLTDALVGQPKKKSIVYDTVALTEGLGYSELLAIEVYIANRRKLLLEMTFDNAKRRLGESGIGIEDFLMMVGKHGTINQLKALGEAAQNHKHGLLIRLLMKLGFK